MDLIAGHILLHLDLVVVTSALRAIVLLGILFSSWWAQWKFTWKREGSTDSSGFFLFSCLDDGYTPSSLRGPSGFTIVRDSRKRTYPRWAAPSEPPCSLKIKFIRNYPLEFLPQSETNEDRTPPACKVTPYVVRTTRPFSPPYLSFVLFFLFFFISLPLPPSRSLSLSRVLAVWIFLRSFFFRCQHLTLQVPYLRTVTNLNCSETYWLLDSLLQEFYTLKVRLN